MARVLVVDDHPIVHLGVERLVESMPSIQMCTGARTAKAGVASLAACVDYTDPHDVHSGARRRAGATVCADGQPVRTRGTHRATCVRPARMTRM